MSSSEACPRKWRKISFPAIDSYVYIHVFLQEAESLAKYLDVADISFSVYSHHSFAWSIVEFLMRELCFVYSGCVHTKCFIPRFSFEIAGLLQCSM